MIRPNQLQVGLRINGDRHWLKGVIAEVTRDYVSVEWLHVSHPDVISKTSPLWLVLRAED